MENRRLALGRVVVGVLPSRLVERMRGGGSTWVCRHCKTRGWLDVSSVKYFEKIRNKLGQFAGEKNHSTASNYMNSPRDGDIERPMTAELKFFYINL